MTSSCDFPAWRDGALLVLPRRSPVAPERCVLTNEPVLGRRMLTRRLTWGSNGPDGLPTKVQILWSLATMRFLKVKFGLNETEELKRRTLIVGFVVAMLSGLALFLLGILRGVVPPPMELLIPGAVLIVLALTLLANTHTVLFIRSMDEEHIWLHGAKVPFLESLPEFRRGAAPGQSTSASPSPSSGTPQR